MNKILFEGSAVALVTPYKNGRVNYSKLEELIEFHIQNLTNAIVVCGTTGEASTMPDEVQIEVIKRSIEFADGRIPIIAGTGSNDTKHSIKLSVEAQELGANGLLLVTPYYNKTTQKGLIEHYSLIADNVDIPIIMYNVKSRTGLNIEPETVKTLSEHPNIWGIKECNFNQVAKIRNLCGKDFAIYSGEDALVVPLLSLGGNGVISVVANVMPYEVSEMVRNYLEGDARSATRMQLYLMDLIDAIFMEVNPIPVKTAMNLMEMDVGECLLPLTSMENNNYLKLRSILHKYGLVN